MSDCVAKAYFLQRITRRPYCNVIPSIVKTFEAEIMFIGIGSPRKVLNTIIHHHSFKFTGILFSVIALLEDVGDRLGLVVMLAALANELGVVALLEDVGDQLGLVVMLVLAFANELGLAILLEDVRDELSFGMLGRRDIGQDLNPGEAFAVESRTVTSILNNSATK
jgi:hypothetical protein